MADDFIEIRNPVPGTPARILAEPAWRLQTQHHPDARWRNAASGVPTTSCPTVTRLSVKELCLFLRARLWCRCSRKPQITAKLRRENDGRRKESSTCDGVS